MIIKDKKAAIKEVFTFLLIAILIGLIFLFAIKTIPRIIQSSCDADEVIFRKDINTFLKKYDTYGSVNIESMILPCDYFQVCFVDKDIIGNSTFNSPNINLMIKDSINNNISYSIFLVKGSTAKPISYSDKLKVVGNYLCIDPVGGKVKVKFTGKGKTVTIDSVNN